MNPRLCLSALVQGRRRFVRWLGQAALLSAVAMGTASCGDDPAPAAAAKPAPTKKLDSGSAVKAEAEVEEKIAVRPAERPPRILTREDFGIQARDPFQGYQPSEVSDAPVEPDHVRQRDVRMPNYDFEDLRLVAIVRSGASIRPRALFVGSDGISKPIAQGEYFSRNEVMLATVNSDYVEIEIVDEELAKGLNMTRGERRAIYLKRE